MDKIDFSKTLTDIGGTLETEAEREAFIRVAQTGYSDYLREIAETVEKVSGEGAQSELMGQMKAEIKQVSDDIFHGGHVPNVKQSEIRAKYARKGLRGVTFLG